MTILGKQEDVVKQWLNFEKKIGMATIALVLAALFFAGCGSKDANDAGASARQRMGGVDRPKAAIPVQVATVVRGDISNYLLHTTSIEAQREVDLIAKVSGQVVKLPAEEGMLVNKGQLLAQLDEAELKIDLVQAKVRMETDKTAFERAKDMLAKNLIAKEAYDTARLQYESSKSAYEAAKLKVDYTSIRAPFAGFITQRQIELGQRVNVNQVLFRLADFNPLRARIYVPEKDMMRLYEGQKASITADALPGMQFSGVVKMISPVVDPTSGTAKVTIDIPDTRGKLKPGMFATVRIITDTRKNTLLIPKKALLLESQTDQVFVYDNGIARKRTLKLGFTAGDTVEVLSGLQEGERVVVIGQEGLREGLPLRIPGQEVTQAPAGSTGQKKQVAAAGMQRAAAAAPSEPANGKVDPEEVARIEKAFLKNPFMKRAYENRLHEEPSMEHDPAKKMAFFKEIVGQMESRAMMMPGIQEEYAKRVQKDPELETDLVKKMAFFREMFRKMRGRR